LASSPDASVPPVCDATVLPTEPNFGARLTLREGRAPSVAGRLDEIGGLAPIPRVELLDASSVAALLGVPVSSLGPACRGLVEAGHLGIRDLTEPELRNVQLEVEAALTRPLPISGSSRLEDWERGWSEIEARFVASQGDPAALEPQYFFKDHLILRLDGRYVKAIDPSFTSSFVHVLQAWVAEAFLRDSQLVYEFGCGPGHNLVALARHLPHARFVGLDWTRASQRILKRIHDLMGLEIRGERFDMFAPQMAPPMEPGASVVTFGAMEQLGEGFDPFLDFLLAARPNLCVHIEPLHEVYDLTNPFDAVAARYAERRGYLRGFGARLQGMIGAGRATLLHQKRILGSMFHDGWVCTAWRPHVAG
jgi:SAM-dependent methyltransferase